MRVVVTRPRHSGERTARRLAAMGHEAVLLPLSEPAHDGTAARTALAGTTGAIAVTSAEAIRALAGLGPDLRPHLDRPLFAVGRTTGQEAEAIGFTTVFISEGSGTELADTIRDHRADPRQSPLLYLAGVPRAAGFETRLAELGITFAVRECYRMEEIASDERVLRRIFLTQKADAVLLYSRRTAMRFFGLPVFRRHAAALDETRFLCLSPAIAEAVPSRWHSLAEVAAMPEEDSLLARLASG